MNIGRTLRILRTAAGVKQADLAKDLDVTASYLSLIENGHREPSISLLKRFAERFDVPLGYLLWSVLDKTETDESKEFSEKMNELLSILSKYDKNAWNKTKI